MIGLAERCMYCKGHFAFFYFNFFSFFLFIAALCAIKKHVNIL